MDEERKYLSHLLKTEKPPTNKTAIQIIEEELHEEEQIKLGYSKIQTSPLWIARKHAEFMKYRFNIEPIIEKVLTKEEVEDIKKYIEINYKKIIC